MTDATRLQEARDTFERTYAELIAVAENYPDALRVKSGASGDHSPREILAKLTGWMQEAVRRFRRYPDGTGRIDYNDDAFTKVLIWQSRDDNYETILAELRQTAEEVLTLVDDIPTRLIDDERYVEWLQRMTNDAATHLADLEAFSQTE